MTSSTSHAILYISKIDGATVTRVDGPYNDRDEAQAAVQRHLLREHRVQIAPMTKPDALAA